MRLKKGIFILFVAYLLSPFFDCLFVCCCVVVDVVADVVVLVMVVLLFLDRATHYFEVDKFYNKIYC